MYRALVLGIIAFYFLVVFLVSWYTTRGIERDALSFYRGDRKSPWWVVAIAMVGTSITGVTYISVPGMVGESQMAYLQMALGFWAGYFVIAFVLLPLYYRLNLTSIYVWLEQRYGTYAHITGTAFFLLSKFLSCSVRMYLTATVLLVVLFPHAQADSSLFTLHSSLIMMFIVWLYSFKGGVKTLVWIDMLQTLCLVCGMVGIVACVSYAMGLDAGALYRTITDSDMSRIWFFDDVNSKHYFWKQFLGGMFVTIAMTGLDQDMMQKNLSCKTLHDAQKNMVTYGFCFIPVNFIFLALGILLYTYAGTLGMTGQDGRSLHSLTGTTLKADELFPYLATAVNPISGQNVLPLAVTVLFVIGLIAAAFSSVGSAVTSLTTAVMVDFRAHNRFVVHLLNCVLVGVGMYVFHIVGSGSVINAIYVIVSYTYGPLLGMFFLGLLTNVHPRRSLIPLACVASPLICYILDTNSEVWFGGYKMGYELLIVNGLITALLLTIGSIGKKKTA